MDRILANTAVHDTRGYFVDENQLPPGIDNLRPNPRLAPLTHSRKPRLSFGSMQHGLRQGSGHKKQKVGTCADPQAPASLSDAILVGIDLFHMQPAKQNRQDRT